MFQIGPTTSFQVFAEGWVKPMLAPHPSRAVLLRAMGHKGAVLSVF